ncbi:MAG: outer rane biosis protein BamB, partial [Planctomycetaceae bacterium]|nr:outer rane biosis protein BamB [Planctomycetaceae bacterium]
MRFRGSLLRLFTVLTVLSSMSLVAYAENWPQWRGPRGDGSAEEPQLPTKWSATENVQWKVKVHAGGHASPIVWGQHVFVVGAKLDETARTLTALDRVTGEVRWEQLVLKAPLERIHKLNSHASSTPATDGKRIYVSFLNEKQMHVTAYDFDGKVAWKVEPGVFSSVHGYCSSPILFENLVIVNGDHDGDSYLVALDSETGKTVWKTPRENRTRSYCTPIIREINGRTQMMLSGNKCVASYDPRTGVRQWIIDGPTEQFVASLVYQHDLLFVTGGFPERHIMAINPTGTGNVTKTNVVWH